jgi:hypothetical protein
VRGHSVARFARAFAGVKMADRGDRTWYNKLVQSISASFVGGRC